MFEIMDEMCELIYIADVKTYDLLFMNTPGKQMFQVGDDFIGKKCYKLLQGLDSPCPFCTNSILTEDKAHTWEYTNLKVNRHYLLKDKLLRWNGILARIEIAFDITENENEKNTLKSTVESERIMIDCIRELHLNNDLNVSIPNILQKVGTYLEAERAYVFNIYDGKMFNTYEWCADGILPQLERLQELDEELIATWMPNFSKSECYVIDDLETIKITDPPTYDILHKQNIHSLITAPLEADGRLVGYIGVDNPPKENFRNVSVLFHTLRYFLMSSIRRVEDEKLLTRLSYHDPLTNAFNRNRYTQDIQNITALNIPIGIVYIDINGLKDMNDRMGHAYGDQIIVSVAQKVQRIFDLYPLYRLGGDEFVVLCKNCSKPHFSELVQELQNCFAMDEVCRVAIGHRWSETSKDTEQQVSLADAMMYEDKKNYYRGASTSNRYRHYNDVILSLGDAQILQRELDIGHFHVHFQPKFSLSNQTLLGIGTIIQYSTSDGNLIPPEQFLPLLEEMNLVSHIDFYVFHWVCANIALWIEEGQQIVPVSVNFSPHSASEPDFVSRLMAICNKYGVDQKHLILKITESSGDLKPFQFCNYLSDTAQ